MATSAQKWWGWGAVGAIGTLVFGGWGVYTHFFPRKSEPIKCTATLDGSDRSPFPHPSCSAATWRCVGKLENASTCSGMLYLSLVDTRGDFWPLHKLVKRDGNLTANLNTPKAAKLGDRALLRLVNVLQARDQEYQTALDKGTFVRFVHETDEVVGEATLEFGKPCPESLVTDGGQSEAGSPPQPAPPPPPPPSPPPPASRPPHPDRSAPEAPTADPYPGRVERENPYKRP